MFLSVTITKDYLFSDSGVVSTVVDLVVVVVVATTGMLSLDRRLRHDLGSHSRSRGLCFSDVLTLLVSA